MDKKRAEDEKNRQALLAAYESARTANEAKTSFLARMSHDIRTPMNAIVGIETGRISLARESVRLQELIGDIATMTAHDIEEKGHRLTICTDGIIHKDVRGDTGRIRQILLNLMTNAVKYTPDGGNIMLAVRETQSDISGYGRFTFVVEDNGIGMDQVFLEHIYDPFERADDEEVKNIQGTGLGMSIVKGLVSMMQGDVQVQSVRGRGTRFTVNLYLELESRDESCGKAEAAGSAKNSMESRYRQGSHHCHDSQCIL